MHNTHRTALQHISNSRTPMVENEVYGITKSIVKEKWRKLICERHLCVLDATPHDS